MKITLLDKSNYLRGLLILIGKDRKISQSERDLLKKLSTKLGFSSEFCENAMNELLENEYIIEEPPIFSKKELAKTFIIDGIKLAFADKELHLFEMNWLKSVASANSIDDDWGMKQFEIFKSGTNSNQEFEINKFLS